jgi:hypothetical protein
VRYFNKLSFFLFGYEQLSSMGEKILNIGAGLILLPIAVLNLIIGIILKREKRVIGTGIIIAGLLIIALSVLLLTGLYDPYSSHIR